MTRLFIAVLLVAGSGHATAQDLPTLGAPSLGVMTIDRNGKGAFVTRVFRKGPADRAGLRRGDLITGVGARPVRSDEDFTASLGEMRVAEASSLTVLRNGAILKFTVVAESAIPLYSRLCDAGDLEACGTIGYMLASGARVTADAVRGEGLLTRACMGGYWPACVNLGNVFEKGSSSAPQPARAAAAYEKACNGALMEGCINLGRLLYRGSGVPKDVARAIKLYQLACDAGDAEVCRILGSIYANGTSVPFDGTRAHSLFQRACALGDKAACERASDKR